MDCPVCGKNGGRPEARVTDFLLETTREFFQMIRCPSCTARYLHPFPSPDDLARFYPPGYWWEPAATGTSAPARALHRLAAWYRNFVLGDHVRFVKQRLRLTPRPSRPLRLLDIGCGAGAFLNQCQRAGFAVHGLDASAQAARYAAQAYGVEVMVSAIDAPSAPAARYDAITMFHVLEHLCDPVAALRTAGQWLVPGGDLIVQVPNGDSLQARWLKTRWYGLDPPRHLINFNLRALRIALARAGFHVQTVRHFSLRDNAPALVSSLLPRLDPMARMVRGLRVGPDPALKRWAAALLYFTFVLGAQPLAMLESLLHRGATIMVHAKKEKRR